MKKTVATSMEMATPPFPCSVGLREKGSSLSSARLLHPAAPFEAEGDGSPKRGSIGATSNQYKSGSTQNSKKATLTLDEGTQNVVSARADRRSGSGSIGSVTARD